LGLKEIFSQYLATRARRTALMVIAANSAFFAALLVVMFYLRGVAEAWPSPFHFASLLMVGGLTMFSLSASVVTEIAGRADFPEREMPARLLAIAIACWLTYLFLEVVEWIRLVYLEGLGPRTAFGGTYLALTVSHWIAVCACVCWLTWVANDTRRRDMLAVSLFSHFLNVVWIVLLFTLYFPNADLEGIA
jgi:heme/copper-type cytochrome/quinol oxidase subunit 3